MKFIVKFAEYSDGQLANDWWEEFDDPRVRDNLDAFAYGKVVTEYWNADLRPGEGMRKVLNAKVTGKGRKGSRSLPKVDRNQLDMFHHRRTIH
jgi:hypothetical protein